MCIQLLLLKWRLKWLYVTKLNINSDKFSESFANSIFLLEIAKIPCYDF